MRLSELTIPSEDIQVPRTGEFLTVRGITVQDIGSITRRHGPAVIEAFEGFVKSKGEKIPNGQEWLEIFDSVPELAGAVIAHASDSPDDFEAAMRLPVTTQVEALMAVVTLSFDGVDHVKKILAKVISGMEGFGDLMEAVSSRDALPVGETSSGNSED